MSIKILVNHEPNSDLFETVKQTYDKTKTVASFNGSNSEVNKTISLLSSYGLDFSTQGIIKHAPVTLTINFDNVFKELNDEPSYIIPIHPVLIVCSKQEDKTLVGEINKTVIEISRFTSEYSPLTDTPNTTLNTVLAVLKKNTVDSYANRILADYKNWAFLGFKEELDVLAVYYAMSCITLTRKTIQ